MPTLSVPTNEIMIESLVINFNLNHSQTTLNPIRIDIPLISKISNSVFRMFSDISKQDLPQIRRTSCQWPSIASSVSSFAD